MAAGAGFGVARGGYYTIESLRLEKGYRAFGRELTPGREPGRGGAAVRVQAEDGHPVPWPRGRREGGPRAHAASWSDSAVDSPDAMLWGGELIMRDGAVAGQVTSAAWGETTGSMRRARIRACVRQLRAVINADGVKSRKLPGQRRRTAVSGVGVAEAALRPDERANTPVGLVGLGNAVSVTVEFRLLGDVEALRRRAAPRIGHARQRCVLVGLLVDVNRPVPADQLIDRVWADDPPHRARNALAAYMSRLRRLLADAADVQIARARRLRAEGRALSVDLHRFRAMVVSGPGDRDPADAAALSTARWSCGG